MKVAISDCNTGLHMQAHAMAASRMLGASKQRVCFDVDSVTADTGNALVSIINRIKGESYSLGDVSSWDWIRDKFKSDGPGFFNEIYNTAWEGYKFIRPLVSQTEMLVLSDFYKVDLVSETLAEAVPYVRKWLSLNFPSMELELVTVDHQIGKANLPYSLYVDDKPMLAEQIEEMEGKLLYLVRGASRDCTYRYNEHIKGSSRIVPVTDSHMAISRLVHLARTAGNYGIQEI